MKKKTSFVSKVRRVAVSNYILWILLVVILWPILFIIQLFTVMYETAIEFIHNIKGAEWTLPIGYLEYKKVRNEVLRKEKS